MLLYADTAFVSVLLCTDFEFRFDLAVHLGAEDEAVGERRLLNNSFQYSVFLRQNYVLVLSLFGGMHWHTGILIL